MLIERRSNSYSKVLATCKNVVVAKVEFCDSCRFERDFSQLQEAAAAVAVAAAALRTRFGTQRVLLKVQVPNVQMNKWARVDPSEEACR